MLVTRLPRGRRRGSASVALPSQKLVPTAGQNWALLLQFSGGRTMTRT